MLIDMSFKYFDMVDNIDIGLYFDIIFSNAKNFVKCFSSIA